MAAKTQSVSRPTQHAVENPVGSRSAENTDTHLPGEQFRDVQARISERAYFLYEEHGREGGHALEDWLEAEQQVLNHSL